MKHEKESVGFCNMDVMTMKKLVLIVLSLIQGFMLSCSGSCLEDNVPNESAEQYAERISDESVSPYFETVEEALANFVGDAVYEPGSGPQESLESIKEKYGEETIHRAIGFYDEFDELLDNRMEELSNVMDTYNKESQNLRKKRDAGSFGEFGEYDRACDVLAERYDSIYAMVEAKYKRLEKELKEKYGDVMELCRKHGLVIQVFFKEMFSDSGQHCQEYGN
jgi:hypothetical protein